MPLTVVLIDDDQDDLDVMKEVIDELDKSIILFSFKNPDEAIRAISNNVIISPNFIFIDINMPYITGDKVLKEFRRNPNLDSVKIVMFSTSMPPHDSQKYRQWGANFAFEKPVMLRSYQSILKNIFSIEA